jgi:hypothetical protein
LDRSLQASVALRGPEPADLRQSQIKTLRICSDLLLPKLGVPSLRQTA